MPVSQGDIEMVESTNEHVSRSPFCLFLRAGLGGPWSIGITITNMKSTHLNQFGNQ